MGNLNSGSQTLNGVRTQTDGRGIAFGHLIPNGGTVSNPFIEWIGNNTIFSTPSTDPNVTEPSGNLDFNFAQSPTGASAVRKTALTIQPVTNVFGAPQFDAFTYARANCLLGQLQSGVYGGLGSNDKWIGIGNVTTSTDSYIGTRIQSSTGNLITGIDNSLPFVQFALPSGATSLPKGFQFRGDAGTAGIINVMQMDAVGRVSMGTPLAAKLIPNINFNLFVGGRSNLGYTASNPSGIGVGIYVRPSEPASINITNSNQKYAVFAEAFGNAIVGSNNAIYATVDNEAALDYSGIFNGKVIGGSFIIASDKRLKKDIKEETSALEKIMRLKPVSYTYDKAASKWMNFEYSKTSHGFIADEVLAVFPEMVNEFNEPVMGNAKEVEAAKKFKAVNYIQLISVLTKAIQEQQVEIIALKNEIVSSRTLVLNNKTTITTEVENAAYSLTQNVPNPFSESTTISYTIPQNSGKAVLAIFDLNGKMLLQYNLQAGKGQTKIQANQLAAGMYIYSLIANGQEVVSKRMVVGR